eukprot:g27933.t1
MVTEAKTAEEEFDVMLCLKLVKVGMQRNKAEAFAEYRMFSIGEWKVRRDGEYLTGGSGVEGMLEEGMDSEGREGSPTNLAVSGLLQCSSKAQRKLEEQHLI